MLNYLTGGSFATSIFSFILHSFCFQIIPKLIRYVKLSIFRQIYFMNTLKFTNYYPRALARVDYEGENCTLPNGKLHLTSVL